MDNGLTEENGKTESTATFVLRCVALSLPVFLAVVIILAVALALAIAPFMMIISGIAFAIYGFTALTISEVGLCLSNIGLGLISIGGGIALFNTFLWLAAKVWNLFGKFYKQTSALFKRGEK